MVDTALLFKNALLQFICLVDTMHHCIYVGVRGQPAGVTDSTLWVPGVELRVSSLAADTFTHKPSCWSGHFFFSR